MITSDEIHEIAAALAKAQGEMGGAVKDSANPFFKSKYADLASVWDACRGPLTRNGLAVVQSPSADGVRVSVDTLLTHTSGQWLRGTVSVNAKDDSPQAVGSAITYLRRYALQSFAGVAPEDDDAEAAHGRGKPGYAVEAPLSPARPMPVSEPATRNPSSPNGGDSGALTIKRVEVTDTKNPNVRKHRIVLSDGREVTTIKQQLAALCEQLAQEHIPVTVETKTTKWGEDLVGVHRIPITLPEIQLNADVHTQPVTADDIPF